jgi:hypothetical protein
MLERLSRREKIGILAAIGVTAITSYFVGHNGQTTVIREVPSPAASSAPKTTPTTKPATVSAAPLKPEGGDYDIAAQAAYDASKADFADAVNLVATISDPNVKALANHAVQMAEGAKAADEANAQPTPDVPDALALLDTITIPDVQATATNAVNKGVATWAAFQAKQFTYELATTLEGEINDPTLVAQVETTMQDARAGDQAAAESVWTELNDGSIAADKGIDSEANAEWATLNRHTTQYTDAYNQAG